MLYSGDQAPAKASELGEDHFEDERLVAFDEIVGQIEARVLAPYRKPVTWLERTRAGLLALLEFCEEQPELAQEVVVESIAWGPQVLERRSRLLGSLAQALEDGRQVFAGGHRPGRPESAGGLSERDHRDTAGALPAETGENLVGACVSTIHMGLVRGGSFLELAPSLMSMIVHPYLGGEVARQELERPYTQMGAEAAERGSLQSREGLREPRY
jgi:hypothetical protein